MNSFCKLLIMLSVVSIYFFGCSADTEINSPITNSEPDGTGKTWYIPGDFATIAEAITNPGVENGDILQLGNGNYTGVLLTKSVSIIGGDNTVINTGPLHSNGILVQGFRLLAGSDNAAFKHLIFTTDLAIMNGAAVDNVEVSHCTFLNSIQAISNWSGNNWLIEHNTITDLRTRNGGGIGILVADRSGGTVYGNVISHNVISGSLHLYEGELGGYAGTGIVIYADFRWNFPGALEIKNNYVTHNTVNLISDNPSLVDAVAFELTDTRNLPAVTILNHNYIGFNDFRGTSNQIALTPSTLDNPVNTISRNLGDNRGQGQFPKDFKP